MKYEKLLQPGKIGHLELKNRFIMGAMGVGFAKLNGHPTDRTVAYYEERAKGGYGLIITEVTRVQDSEFCTPFEPSLGSDEFIPEWKKQGEDYAKPRHLFRWQSFYCRSHIRNQHIWRFDICRKKDIGNKAGRLSLRRTSR